MKLVYIAGPYSAPTEYGVKKNIQRAEDLAAQVWETRKAAAICPHLNTAHWGGVLTHEEFIDGDLEIIIRCDAVLMVPGWPNSKGATTEREFAVSNNIPVFHYVNDLEAWLEGKR